MDVWKWCLIAFLCQHVFGDDDYNVKCHTSNTGLFSFFAVPILLGDITLDFMSMIDVTVNVMVTNTNMNMGMGGNNNNNNNNNNGMAGMGGMGMGTGNNNNNNNNNGRRKRSVKQRITKDIIDSAVDTFLQDENERYYYYSMDQQKVMAHNHVDQYLTLMGMLEKPGSNVSVPQSIGHRATGVREAVLESAATQFIHTLMDSYMKLISTCDTTKANLELCHVLDQMPTGKSLGRILS